MAESNGKLKGHREPQQHNSLDTLVFVLSIVGVLLVSNGFFTSPWIPLYFFSIATPLLLGLRFWVYWQTIYRLAILDWCYFANIFFLVFLWAFPTSKHMFYLSFAHSNALVLCSIYIYRCSITFHSMERMIAAHLHFLPSLIMFLIRWYPDAASSKWYAPFAEVAGDEMTGSSLWLWLVAVPIICFMCHTVIYYAVVYLLIKPDSQFQNVYQYHTSGKAGWISKFGISCIPQKYLKSMLFPAYITTIWCHSLALYIINILVFRYFLVHCVYLLLFGCCLIWNTATFHVRVFAKRGLDAEPYRLCTNNDGVYLYVSPAWRLSKLKQ